MSYYYVSFAQLGIQIVTPSTALWESIGPEEVERLIDSNFTIFHKDEVLDSGKITNDFLLVYCL
ncbi:3708_t:CDS:2, partial [Diversispora eburnea]